MSAKQSTAFLIPLYSIPTWMWMKNCMNSSHMCVAGLPVFLTLSNPTPAPPWRVWALSMQLPGHHKGRYSMDKDELGLCCKYTKQLRSAPIFVKSSNSSTIMQYTDINRYRRIILVSAMFTNIISFLAAATRAMLIALLLLSVISQDSPMQHSTDQKRTRHSRCMCIYTHYIAYVIQTQSYA